jgi:hypothetical protein
MTFKSHESIEKTLDEFDKNFSVHFKHKICHNISNQTEDLFLEFYNNLFGYSVHKGIIKKDIIVYNLFLDKKDVKTEIFLDNKLTVISYNRHKDIIKKYFK